VYLLTVILLYRHYIGVNEIFVIWFIHMLVLYSNQMLSFRYNLQIC